MFEIDNNIISAEELTEKVRHKVFEKKIPQERSKTVLNSEKIDFYELHREIDLLMENIMDLNSLWLISEVPLRSNRRIIGKGIVFVKKCIRKCLRWLLRPYFDQITNFNGAATRAISDLVKSQEKLITTIEELTSLEER